MSVPKPLNFKRWIDENRHLLKPPVGNRRIFRDSQFIVMAVGGPNSRKDYHVDPGEELFYQVEGELLLKTVQNGAVIDVRLQEGDMFLLPAGVPHSPRRGAATVGLVVERDRRPGEQDGLQWYCEHCGTKLYEEFFALTNIETQFPPVFERFFGNPRLTTCGNCGSVQTR